MAWLWQGAIILGMFILRLGVPLLITLAVGYWLRRLDAKWQAEAQGQAGQVQNSAEPARQASPVDRTPCWMFQGCPEAIRDQCPAFQQPDLPCWLARHRAEGRIPATCYDCELFVAA